MVEQKSASDTFPDGLYSKGIKKDPLLFLSGHVDPLKATAYNLQEAFFALRLNYPEVLEKLGKKYDVSFEYSEEPTPRENFFVYDIQVRINRVLNNQTWDELFFDLLGLARSLFR